jgi:hypothetical protein
VRLHIGVCDGGALQPGEEALVAVSAEAVVLKVDDARRAAEFWTAALDYKAEEGSPDFLVPSQGNGVRIHLDERDRTSA